MAAIDKALDWVNNHSIIRRVVLFITLWMTWEAFHWASQYAYTTKLDGVGTAAVIAAVTGPISVLQGYVFKVYAGGRNG
jgi:hypothetical protein